MYSLLKYSSPFLGDEFVCFGCVVVVIFVPNWPKLWKPQGARIIDAPLEVLIGKYCIHESSAFGTSFKDT